MAGAMKIERAEASSGFYTKANHQSGSHRQLWDSRAFADDVRRMAWRLISYGYVIVV